MKNNWKEAAHILKNGGIAVIPTDTLYGLVGNALDKKIVERIYKLKGRDHNKPLIVLISSLHDLARFGVKISPERKKFLTAVWPGKISIILSCPHKRFNYVHRNTNAIAFRMIGHRNKNLYGLLRKVGPLVAPSANPQGKIPARTITEAKNYFGDAIDLYISGGLKNSKPSTLVDYTNDVPVVLRQGATKIK